MRLEFRHRKLWWLIRLFYLKQALYLSGSPEKLNLEDTYIHIYEIYCQNWRMQLWRAGSNTVCPLQVGEPGKPVVQFSPSLYSRELVALMLRAGKARHSRSKEKEWTCPYFTFLFHLDLQHIGWSPPTWMRMDFFPQFTRSNTNLFQKHFHRNQK